MSSQSIPFMIVTRDKISKGDIVLFEGKKCKITSIKSVEPFGSNIKIIGRCKQTEIDKWSAIIKNS